MRSSSYAASSQLLKTAGYYQTISSAFASDILQYTKLTVYDILQYTKLTV
jgi:hypothetical protein